MPSLLTRCGTHFLPLFFLLVTASSAFASSGDRSSVFQGCLERCLRHSCTPEGRPLRPQSLALWLTRWTCADDCKYTCMHTLTDLAAESGVQMQQYYGKWPFWRIAGMQEPAAVAFSFGNLLIHVLGVDWLRRGMHPAHPMRPFYLTWAYVSINAWVWSAVFHTRGTCPVLLFPLPCSLLSLSIGPGIFWFRFGVHFYPSIHPSIHLMCSTD